VPRPHGGFCPGSLVHQCISHAHSGLPRTPRARQLLLHRPRPKIESSLPRGRGREPE
jgi:hypothetical protein